MTSHHLFDRRKLEGSHSCCDALAPPHAALMGVGGVMALGCTIGQGVTGLSTLAPGSLIAVAAIVTGAVLGLKTLERLTD